ncbi:signal recognition particle-docking protein FtsY [Acidihalobacter prosperus]|uniref:Signal recognition particle receptor FtsY n=1 Tax=Acidihalobacter prosperus TaxID=160660 RepID=A0A1A6C0V2_9GAMM|nr:signal recognition particle-docking protein FtsY [Acidihalobacter prosperus]OBS08191.1 signal recognition particle protein [Acidihalobacter prosperus]
MFGFTRRKKSPDQDTPENAQPSATDDGESGRASDAAVPEPPAPAQAPARGGLLSRLREGLSKTGRGLTGGVASLVLGRKAIDDALLEELETRLLMADVGIEATTRIIDDLTARVRRKQLGDAEALFAALHENMTEILRPVTQPLVVDASRHPYVILMVGINGAGKTTTIGKLAKHLQGQGKSVLLAAGDTFRAAAVEQLQAWGARNEVQVIAQGSGADSASVIFDGLQAARARGIDVLIADTAGRLHTQTNLMDELRKVKRVIAKLDSDAPHEIMLVVDAGIGQNALIQAREFHNALGLTGITVTKLDGTAKGGILFAIAQQIGIPIRFIGVGEAVDDLRTFEAGEFVSALLAEQATTDE